MWVNMLEGWSSRLLGQPSALEFLISEQFMAFTILGMHKGWATNKVEVTIKLDNPLQIFTVT